MQAGHPSPSVDQHRKMTQSGMLKRGARLLAALGEAEYRRGRKRGRRKNQRGTAQLLLGALDDSPGGGGLALPGGTLGGSGGLPLPTGDRGGGGR